MEIAVIQDDEVEDEFEIEMCCHVCAGTKYGWNERQFNRLMTSVEKREPVTIPSGITTLEQFISHVKSL